MQSNSIINHQNSLGYWHDESIEEYCCQYDGILTMECSLLTSQHLFHFNAMWKTYLPILDCSSVLTCHLILMCNPLLCYCVWIIFYRFIHDYPTWRSTDTRHNPNILIDKFKFIMKIKRRVEIYIMEAWQKAGAELISRQELQFKPLV